MSGLLTNEELAETMIGDINAILRDLVSGQYIQMCSRIVELSRKTYNLKNGIKSETDNKNRIIEDLKNQLRNAGKTIIDMTPEELIKKG